MNWEDSTAKEGYGECYWKKYRTIKDNKKMHMLQVRDLLFCGSNNLSSNTEINNSLEEVFKNQEEPESSFDNSCHCTTTWKSITKVLIQNVIMH